MEMRKMKMRELSEKQRREGEAGGKEGRKMFVLGSWPL